MCACSSSPMRSGRRPPARRTPDGYYNVERMLKAILAKGGQIKLCGSCADARGFDRENAVPGVLIGSMPELADWVVEAEKSLVF